LKRYEDALQAYDKAINIHTSDSSQWQNKGITLANLTRYEEAIAAYDNAIKFNNYFSELLNLTVADSWYARGLAFYAMRRYQDAVRSFDKAIAERSDFADAIKARSIAQKQLR
jgi:tetratricopeptide (TPR) repeat protein